MTEDPVPGAVGGTAAPQASPSSQRTAGGLFRTLEVDTRLLGMILALIVIWLGFNLWSDGLFLSSRNLWNLSIQTASTAVMATGMVLIIVSRNIDLSVGSMVGVIGMIMALFQVEWLPKELGVPLGEPWMWIVTVLMGLALGAVIGSIHGGLVAYIGIPSFIVTLGGLLVWRGVTFQIAAGRTIAPMDATYQLLGGGPKGSVGETVSWIIAGLVIIGIIYALLTARRRKIRYGFPVRPLWAEFLIGGIASGVVLLAARTFNDYAWPVKLAEQYAAEQGIPVPEGGLIIGTGVANPVLIALGVAGIMTILATRRRFGRYVYAIGGNPEAAELSGINTRRTIMWTFIIMGVLAAVSAVISTARLNAAVNGLGTGAELQVIAAAVIGGTSFAGGIGSVPGAILGALVMQSIVNGMQLMRFDNAVVDITVGIVLVVAVGIDTIIRRRAS
jgi:D-xylose transport system permease protein